MLWDIEIRPDDHQPDREGTRLVAEAATLGLNSIKLVRSARSFLIEGNLDRNDADRAALSLLVDQVVESVKCQSLDRDEPTADSSSPPSKILVNVLYKPGVTDNVAHSALQALRGMNLPVERVATCRRYWINDDARPDELKRFSEKVLSNSAIEHIVAGPLKMTSLSIGHPYAFSLQTVPIRTLGDDELLQLSRVGQLALRLDEMQVIQNYFRQQEREPTDIELETIAQTWSEHCSHKTLAGRVRYRETSADGHTNETYFQNLLKETVFAATMQIREQLGNHDWCVSVFRDNAGVVKFDDEYDVCMKVETHNHPSAIEPYGGANTGLGGVIRDPLGTGLGAKPVCNTDVFCFAPPTMSDAELPPGVLHPRAVLSGVVAGVRDYGNRMGIPTVNGAILFDERYLGNPLVYCGNVAMIPVGKSRKQASPGDYIVTVGGRTGRDGIHGATFSSIELTHESEELSGGAVQIGNAITEKMVLDALMTARDRGLYSAITDCGAGGFSSAIGEMGEETGAEVWLEKAPLKYAGLSYTEIWISEAQERMILAVPPQYWEALHRVCADEGVEATIIGQFTDTHRLVLKYDNQQVGDLAMSFLHDGRPPTVREAVYRVAATESLQRYSSKANRFDDDLKAILGSGNVCSKEWVIRQYDHEVQAGSVVKPLVGVNHDGPSDAAVVQPRLTSRRGLVIGCGMNPRYGDLDPYWMVASAIDEAIRNCVAVGADPRRIAILDNFCWGQTDRPETLGSLVRAAIACRDFALGYNAPFISGKDSLNNEFSYIDADGKKQTVVIPSSLLISALGQIDDVRFATTMDFKEPDNLIYIVGKTADELGGSHWGMVQNATGGRVPRVDATSAVKIYQRIHSLNQKRMIRSCHDLSEGGLAVALAESAFAGGCGATCNLAAVPTDADNDDVTRLFSESNSRLVLEVKPEHQKAVDDTLSGIPHALIGRVTTEPKLVIRGTTGETVIDSPLDELKAAWQKTLSWD